MRGEVRDAAKHNKYEKMYIWRKVKENALSNKRSQIFRGTCIIALGHNRQSNSVQFYPFRLLSSYSYVTMTLKAYVNSTNNIFQLLLPEFENLLLLK